MVEYAGEAIIADGANPIHGISLLNVDIGDAMRPELEEVRRLTEKDRKISARDFRKGKIDEAAVKANTQRYEDAIVNYYLGLRAYRDRLAAVPRQ